MLTFVVGVVLIGTLGGYVGRMIVPGPDPMSFLGTVAVGIIGCFLGGFLGYLIFDVDVDEGWLQPSGLVGSIIGSAIAVAIGRFVDSQRRRIT